MKPTPLIAWASLLAVAGHGAAAEAAPVLSDEAIKADLKDSICTQDWKAAIQHSGRLMASATITPEHRQELVNWRYRFSQYAASGTLFAEIPTCGFDSASAPKAPIATPATPAAPAQVSTPVPAPRLAAAPNAMCYVTYSDGRTVNLDHLCQRNSGDRVGSRPASLDSYDAPVYDDAFYDDTPYNYADDGTLIY